MIKITLSYKKEKFMRCNYLWLDPYAPNTERRLVFSGVLERKNIIIRNETISVDIIVRNKLNEWVFFAKFDIWILDYDDENITSGTWWVLGNISNIGSMRYSQKKMDCFNDWQNGKVSDWFSLPLYSQVKLDCIGACMIYSGLSTKIIEKETYYFDMSLIKEERDFCYLASLEFVGDRGYFGHNLYTFEDCLLEMYKYNGYGYFQGRKIVFLNADKLNSPVIASLIDSVKAIFERNKFTIVYGSALK